MISTSFLRTLNPKKYNDYTTVNRNKLRVFYIRTINRLNREARLNSNSQKYSEKKSNRCTCKHQSKLNKSQKVQWGIDRGSRLYTLQQCLEDKDEEMHKHKCYFQPKNIVLEFQNTRLQCENKLEKIEKQNLIQCRKLAHLPRTRKIMGRNTAFPLMSIPKQLSPR